MERDTSKTDGLRDTPGRILKVNHAGEVGAVNIYRAQILVTSLHRPSYRESLKAFLSHEKEHRAIFSA
jgi:ubiquinone biosynthesis monooxygenase Coq7